MSILGASWLCIHCGIDICPACYDALNPIVSIVRLSLALLTHQQMTPCQQDNAVPNRCSAPHNRSCFLPSSRFSASQLSDTIRTATTSLLSLDVTGLASRTFFFKEALVTQAQTRAITLRIPARRLRVEEFRYLWTRRLPLVVTDINSRMQLSWSPQQLAADYGKQNCTIEDCEGHSDTQKVTLAMFMKRFDDTADDVIWKLKV
jgi:lysine-specific demethylase 3